MKTIIFLILLLGSSTVFASDFVSVALCTPTQKESIYKSIELFYDDEASGFFIVELALENMPQLRLGATVTVEDLGDFLTISADNEKFSIQKNAPNSTFEIDGAEFKCERADW